MIKLDRKLKLRPSKKVIILKSDSSYGKNNEVRMCHKGDDTFRHRKPFNQYYYVVYAATDRHEMVEDAEGQKFDGQVFQQCRIDFNS